MRCHCLCPCWVLGMEPDLTGPCEILFLLRFIASWTCVVVSVMLYPCIWCVSLLVYLFVLCIACLTVFVNCWWSERKQTMCLP